MKTEEIDAWNIEKANRVWYACRWCGGKFPTEKDRNDHERGFHPA